MRSLIYSLSIIACLTLSACGEKYALDKQMEELCKKDGGVKVFEQVKLPASEFNANGGLISHYSKETKEEDRYGTSFEYKVKRETLKQGDIFKGQGLLIRMEENIYRRADHKLLGVSVAYLRGGGDSIVIGHPSNASCPIPAKSLSTEIFVKGE